MADNRAVFHDESGRRWFIFKSTVAFVGIGFIFLTAVFLLSIIIPSPLGNLSLGNPQSGEVMRVNSDLSISRWGHQPNKVVLTFDDGPDQRNTPKILDVLKAYNIKATFFVVGANANHEPEILRRIYSEGHEIGNHTYNHLDSSKTDENIYKLEINTTQRLIESTLGVQTILFRPPYSDDNDPQTAEQLKPLVKSSNLGYYSVGMRIDPKDWQRPGVDKIAERVISQVTSGKGNIVLLHDAGDDRSQTIEALPLIIETLENRGYEFTNVSGLLGLTRDDVMPKEINPIWQDIGTKLGFVFLYLSRSLLLLITATTVVIGVGRFITVTTLAIFEKRKPNTHRNEKKYRAQVAAIVPAFNEEKVVNKTVASLLESDYKNLKVIVIDDGSKDNTHKVVQKVYGKDPRVINLRKPNGGKSSAINFGLNHTNAEIVILMDADTIIAPDAISKLVSHFSNSKVGAVAGNAKVGNQLNLLTRLQAVEYITSQNLERRAFAFINCIRVVPGAIGAWRRDLILKDGGFKNDTLAEDTDMTLSILRMGYKVGYEPYSLGYTEAPDTVNGFLKQRYRWMHGTLQAIWKHIDTLMNRKYGTLGLVAIPDVILFQVIFPLFAPMMDFLLITNIGAMIIQIINHPNNYSTQALKQALLYYLAFLVFDYITALSAFLMERKENWKLLVWFFLQRFFYRQLLYITAIRSTLSAIRGKPVGWGKLERKSTVERLPAYNFAER